MKPMMDDVVDVAGDEMPPLPSRPMPSVPGYDQLEEIGRGGMGVVYRARHGRLGRAVALKLLRGGAAAGAQDRERFLREARAGAALQHPHIVQIFDVGEYIGAPYLAMELVEGSSLAERLAAGPMPPREAAELIEKLARAVEHAHEHGVVHRDLKPANVLIADLGLRIADLDKSAVRNEQADPSNQSAIQNQQNTIPKIADFGLARLVADESGGTLSGTILGTPSYMSPEQASGRLTQVGPASDVYSLGAILYECLTGRPPFRAASAVETLHQVETVEPVSPSRLQHSTPRDLSTICLTCLQKEPRRRYASAGALADDLRSYLDGRPIHARPVGAWERTWRWCRRNPRVAILLTALALAIVGGFIGIFGQWRRAEHLFTVADVRRTEAEANLKRYQQAAEDFADLIDLIDMDQLLNLRAAAMRRELLVPALERNRQFLEKFGTDPAMRAEIVRAQFRVAVLMRLLSQLSGSGATYEAALVEGRKALADVEALATEYPTVVQYRRDRAALTQNIGYLTHATGHSADALPVMESARRMRQELLDSQPDHLDYRSELAGAWNDIGLVHHVQRHNDEALAALQRAIELQKEVVKLAPHVARYRRFLCNHYFNSAMSYAALDRPAEAVAAINECRAVLPHDPDQWIRVARIHAIVSKQPNSDQSAAEAVAALRQAVKLGFRGEKLRSLPNLAPLHQRADFAELEADLERRAANADRQ